MPPSSAFTTFYPFSFLIYNIGERALKIIKSKTESLEKDKSKETIHHMYNSEKEIKSTQTVDICNNQEDYDPTLVLIADNIDSDKAKVLENSKDIRKEITISDNHDSVFDFMIFNALSPMFVCLITQKAHV
jgi:hypothetical protein